MADDRAAWRKQHEAELARTAAERRAEKDAKREANRAAWAAMRASEQADQRVRARERHQSNRVDNDDDERDPFVLEMAARQGLTPREFLDLQAQRRAEMAKARPVAEQMANMKPVDDR